MMVKAPVKARGDLYFPFESLGLRYLIQFEVTKEIGTRIISRDNSNTNMRQNCASNLASTITSIEKGSRQPKIHQIKDVDRTVQRPRAVLSSPDNDLLIKEMNKRTLKQDSGSKAPTRRLKSAYVNIENAPIRIRGTNSTFNSQHRPKVKDSSKSSVAKEKTCITRLKS
ncbi:uncharacterized protein LOC143562006 [Bidens hawaiensis]|uniref:uncharacterized protein LOC143562006 n=1 Tax=Bidens hawaiensis TaxID=980011 RepID=UPI00404B88F1